MTHAPLGRANGGMTFLRPVSSFVSHWFSLTCKTSRRSSIARCLAVAFAASLLQSVAFAAPPRWKVLEAPRFTVVSQLSEDSTRDWANEFNRYLDSLRLVVTVDERCLPKLTVVIFSRDRDFRPYLPSKPNGEPREVGGYFAARETWGVIGLPPAWSDEFTRRAIFHEGAHWFLSQYQGRLPLSLEEGFAEVCSSFEVRADRAIWGKPLEDSVLAVRELGARLESVHDLMLMGSRSSAFNSDHRTDRFYAQSWLFVHYLMFGARDKGEGSLSAFLKALNGEPTVEAAFVKTFGKASMQVDEDLRRYANRGRYFEGSRTIDLNAKVGGDFREAEPVVIEIALARLALGSRHAELALKHAQTAVAIAPTSPAAYDTLAFVLNENGAGEGGVEEAEKAIALGSRDAGSYVLAAAGRSRSSFGGLSHREARRLTNLLEKAINLHPKTKSAYVQLAFIIGQLETVREQDEPFLDLGAQLFPEEGVLKLGLAQVRRKRGDRASSWAMVQAILNDKSKLDANLSGFARWIVSDWTLEDARQEIEPLVTARRFPEALAVFDRSLSQEYLTRDAYQVLARERENVAIEANLQAATLAVRKRDVAEATRLLALIDAAPRVSGRVRQEASELADRIQKLSATAVPKADEP